MKPLLIFSGRLGSGKTTISKEFADCCGMRWNGFGMTVKQVALERGIEVSRENLQILGQQLVEKEKQSFCERVIKNGNFDPKKGGILDGLRHVEIYEEIKILVAPINVICVFVDIDESVRMHRLRMRDNLSANQIRQHESHITERDVIENIKGISDIVVDNSGSQQSTINDILRLLHSLSRNT